MTCKRCIKCNELKPVSEFYANWSHWCNKCIEKRKNKIEYEELKKRWNRWKGKFNTFKILLESK